MLKFNVIGCGAAGNKAVADLINTGYNKDLCLFINSTQKDIPSECRDKSLIFGAQSGIAGCGKERDLGKSLLLNDMQKGFIDIDSFIAPDADAVVICGSTGGGSGSASIPILAKYVNSVFKNSKGQSMPVLLALFFGFNDDVREMQNTIELCQEIDPSTCAVIGIRNDKFLDIANDNRSSAEDYANSTFISAIYTLIGKDIVESDQNIDDTDLYKVISTPGYMTVGDVDIGKCKNISQFESAISNAIDNTKLMEAPKGSCKRMAVVFNIDRDIFIDRSAGYFKKVFGTPYEYFAHVQKVSDHSSMTAINFVSWIISGQKMPIDEIKEIYSSYSVASENVDKSDDEFSEIVDGMRGNPSDAKFNTFGIGFTTPMPTAGHNKAKADFFKSFGFDKTQSKDEQTKKDKKVKDVSDY